MPPTTDSAALVVARFLRANHLTESYEIFVREAGLPQDAGDLTAGDLTLETLLQEKKTFDLNVRFERLGSDDDGASRWTVPAPLRNEELNTHLPRANVLSTIVEKAADERTSLLITTAADCGVHLVDMVSDSPPKSLTALHESPILACAVFRGIMLCGSMSGHLLANDLQGKAIDKRKDHNKYVVKIAVLRDGAQLIVATAGWDNTINIYHPTTSPSFSFNDPVATITLSSRPESLIFLRHPDNSQPILLLSRADSSHLFYYTTEAQPRCLGKQNLAPHSNAWVAFTPSSLALCPTDSSLLAVGTSSMPHMKLLIVRLLIPPFKSTAEASRSSETSIPSSTLHSDQPEPTQASLARAALLVADRESSAVQIHCTTWAPQTAYSTPTVAWRPDGSGVWVNGDDGAVRGIEASSGKLVSTLKGHEDGVKVRCLWAGNIEGKRGEEEVLISGGFDQKLIAWKI